MPVNRLRNILKLAGVLVFAGVLSMAVYLFLQEPPEIKIQRVEEPLAEDGENVLGSSVTSTNNELIFTSEVYEAQMQFNAIALNWKETGISWEEGRRVFLRTSLDNQRWGEWMEVESLGPLRDVEEIQEERIFPEVPLLVDGKFFQYQVIVRQDRKENAAPQLSDVWVTYIDSRTPIRLKIIGVIKELLPIAQAANEGPAIISRAGWGSPDPYGKKFVGTTRYWNPAYSPVKQIFLHHTVFYNTSDPAAAVRAIWEFHTYTRGWGDIGYNYLVDQQGRVYEGRFGGDNVVAGHAYTFNIGSLGVAVLGCFQSTSSSCAGAPPPSSTMLNSLTTLLAWKSTNYEINPTATQTFCGLSSCKTLKTIAGHRDVNATACPGNLVYNQLATLRNQTAGKLGNWGYSAKQLNFSGVRITEFNVDQSATLSFKNTGTATWTNTGSSRLLLKVANPNSRTSAFQGSGWINNQTPAALNEATVSPGETGTFTFNLKTALPTNRRNSPESFRLVLEDGSEISQVFTVVVRQPVDALADVAAFYDAGDCQTRLDSFLSTGGGLELQGETGWWSSSDYCASKIIHATPGDFNNDGVSDIAVFYEPVKGETKIHVWLGNGTGFEFQGENGWWQSIGYTTTKVKHALSGDFNGDGKDDLAAFYDYGNGATRIHTFISTGSSFNYQDWWRVDRGYSLARTTGASVGHFNGDNYADLALFYDYGGSAARIHVWLSNGSSFRYQGAEGWWRVDRGYALTKTTSTPGGHLNLDRYSDLAMFYDYGSGEARIHTWLSNGSSFRYQGSNGWWKVTGYSLSQVPFASASFHSPVYGHRREDIISVYDYPGNETRMHALLSTGGSFLYQGPGGWWGSTDYNTSNIIKVVSGHFGSQ